MSDICISCNAVVTPRQHAVSCDVCERWQHRICGTGISQAQYFSARREELELKFVCQPCVVRIPPRDNDGVEGRGDDTAADYIKFKCRDFASVNQMYELTQGVGQGDFGSFGVWSESCPVNSAVCGIQSRIEGPQGSGDDTALNDVKLFCCDE